MGTDIFMYAEALVGDDQWVDLGYIELDRPYWFFALLSGVRGEPADGGNPISEDWRGPPKGCVHVSGTRGDWFWGKGGPGGPYTWIGDITSWCWAHEIVDNPRLLACSTVVWGEDGAEAAACVVDPIRAAMGDHPADRVRLVFGYSF